jgi:hypothetical protein
MVSVELADIFRLSYVERLRLPAIAVIATPQGEAIQ